MYKNDGKMIKVRKSVKSTTQGEHFRFFRVFPTPNFKKQKLNEIKHLKFQKISKKRNKTFKMNEFNCENAAAKTAGARGVHTPQRSNSVDSSFGDFSNF